VNIAIFYPLIQNILPFFNALSVNFIAIEENGIDCFRWSFREKTESFTNGYERTSPQTSLVGNGARDYDRLCLSDEQGHRVIERQMAIDL
jgi:hypothetical protein